MIGGVPSVVLACASGKPHMPLLHFGCHLRFLARTLSHALSEEFSPHPSVRYDDLSGILLSVMWGSLRRLVLKIKPSSIANSSR